MLILRLFRFIRGYVAFSASQGFPERFVNLCRRFGIPLWDLKSREGGLTACTDCASYKKIRSVARRSGMKTRIVSKHGLGFLVNRYNRRIGLAAGAIIGISVLIILSSRIWLIEVAGNNTVPSEKIISVFEQLGVTQGAPAERIKVDEIEKEASKLLPELSWLNINIDGCSAFIEVREASLAPETVEEDTPCNVVAARDGTIVELRPFRGTQEQKIGSAVLKGDLLISGMNENRDLSVSFCRAEGYVVARTEHKIEFRQAQSVAAFTVGGKNKGYIIRFLIFEIPIGKIPQNGFAEEKRLCINGVNLPLSITCVSEKILKEEKITLSEEKTAMLAKHEFFGLCVDEFRGLKTEKAEIKQNGGQISGMFTCLENIAEQQPMEIEEEMGGKTE